jgi:hypothetical protein
MKKRILKLPQVQCSHWTDDGLNGVCDLDLYGGRPSVGLCKKCESYSGPEDRVTGEPAPAPPASPLFSPQRLLQIETHKEACRACEYWLGGFELVKGTDVEGYTKCEGCNCPAKRVSLFSGYCPKDNW